MIVMDLKIKEAIINDFKEALKLPKEPYGLSILPDRETVVNAKEEILRLIFSRKEILRFKNETEVENNPRAIRGLDEFEKMLHLVSEWNLPWNAKSIEEAYQLYVKDFEKEDQDEFTKLAERAKYITENLQAVRLETVDEMDINLLRVGSLIEIVDENTDNKGDYYHKCNFSIGKSYEVVELGDGFMLSDDEGHPYHISTVETYYKLEIV